MADPYRVLGISAKATDEEVKEAYRKLAKKYHPDQYEDSPLKNLADEKMKEINEAYDTVVSQRKTGGGPGVQYAQGRQGAYNPVRNSENSDFRDVRSYISAQRIAEAEQILNGIPLDRQNAEWFFLKGSVLYRRGWMEEAKEHFARACQMDPENQEYRAAYHQLMHQGRDFGGTMRGGENRQVRLCLNLCQTWMCLECCCNCCDL